MYIRDLFLRKKPVIYFEIFPPKKDYEIDTIYSTINELVDLDPDFISVTYGAGGIGSNKTAKIASIVKNKYGIEALAHLTCITSDKDKVQSTINVPVSAGVMPILSKNQIQKMIFMCGASLPSKIIKMLYKYENNPESLRKAGIEHASGEVIDLIANGIDGVHIYTMNQPEIAKEILRNLRPKRAIS